MNQDWAFRLALVVERAAKIDANTWVARLQQQAHLVAHGRAAQVIEPHKTTLDPLRTALTREWYVRVFDDQVRKRLGVAAGNRGHRHRDRARCRMPPRRDRLPHPWPRWVAGAEPRRTRAGSRAERLHRPGRS